MKMRTLIRLATLFILPAGAFCQSAEWPDSSAPGLRPPAKARWSVAYHALEGATVSKGDSTDALPARAEYELNLPQGKAVITFRDGGKKTIYLVDDLTFTRAAGSERILADIAGPFSDPDGWFGRSYPGFSWISRKTYAGIVEIDGKKFHHFKTAPVPSRGDDEDPTRVTEESEAWVEVGTKRPWQFRRGNLIGLYRHEEPPGAPVALTPEFEKALRIYYGYNE